MTSSAICNWPTWDEVEESESYLVCCMFEDAELLAYSILKRLQDNAFSEMKNNAEFYEMEESAGMVFIQAHKELRRTSEIFGHLKAVFGSFAAIPFQVVLAGACFQIEEGCITGLPSVLSEYLDTWKYVDGNTYCLLASNSYIEGSRYRLNVDAYVIMVEIYCITLLGKTMGLIELADKWVESAALPEDIRKDLLRRLHSLCPDGLSVSSVRSKCLPNKIASCSCSSMPCDASTFGPIDETCKSSDQDASNKRNLLSRYSRIKNCFRCSWWRDRRYSKSSCRQLVFWGSLILFTLYILRRKGSLLKRFLKGQALLARKVLLDFWQLAFSLQMDPLAASHVPQSLSLRNNF